MMNVDELLNYGIPERAIEILKREKIEKLYPHQEDAIKKGLLDLKKNFLISVPTASGKTLLAELLSLKSVILRGGKVLYVVPLRALASEKFKEYKKYEDLGVKVAVSTGDYDSSDPWLKDYHIIITTSEKADSLLRHKASWLNEVNLLVVDEIHLLNDPQRGATLEILIAKLKKLVDPLILGLSATVKNSEEIASWLNAVLIKSDFRPVKLREGVFLKGRIYYKDGGVEEVTSEDYREFVLNYVKSGAQALIFVNRRKDSQNLAFKLSRKMKLDRKMSIELKRLAEEVLSVLSEPTEICRMLASCIERGVAFHNAGLANEQREIVEEAFRNNLIKIVVATPTLAAGVNLPARLVLIRDYKRYDTNLGYVYMPVMEIKQMLGRAGRPKYDNIGIALILARSEDEKEFLMESYIRGEVEPIYSKLAVESILRGQLLSLIATEIANSEKEIMEIIENTFFAYQSELYYIEHLIDKILGFLEENNFIKNYEATKLGKRVSELYLDPMSAVYLIEALKNAEKKEYDEFSFLHAITKTSELGLLYLRKKDYETFIEEFYNKKSSILFEEELDEVVLAEIKTALFLNDWINEVSEEKLLEKYGIAPGDIFSKVEVAEWLVYSMRELGKIVGINKEVLDFVERLRVRIRYGVKEELVELVRIEGIGRARARALYNAGFMSLEDIRSASTKELAKVRGIGEKLAEKIKSKVMGIEYREKKEHQTTLHEF